MPNVFIMAGHAQDAHKIVTFVAFAILDFLKVLNYQLCSFFLNGLEKVFFFTSFNKDDNYFSYVFI